MKVAFLILAFIHSAFCWTLRSTYNHTNFFNNFNFYNKKDPSGGVALYQNETSARAKGLIQTIGQRVLLRADNKTISSAGRDSIRMFTKESYNHGLFIIDLNHIPTGCGTWPAFWMVGNSWSQNGELDIIEGVNKATRNTISIHTNSKCIISSAAKLASGVGASSFTCSGTKCTSRINNTQSFGQDFNKNKGGVYVLQWLRATSFHIWFFPRQSIPADIKSGRPVPSQWSPPALRYNYGICNPGAFSNLTITLDLALCGSWAGNSASYKGCPSTCESYVKKTPHAFSEAYWDINYIKVYQ